MFRAYGTVERGQWLYYGPFEADGDVLADLTVRGDADLFVAKDVRPTERDWDCRSANRDSNETCYSAFDGDVYLAVYGHLRSDFELDLRYIPAETRYLEECSPDETFRTSGVVTKGEWRYFGPFSAPPNHEFRALLTGNGDADLYVRRDLMPTESAWDCRPLLASSNETCSLSTDDAADFYVGVHGYSTSSAYSLFAILKELPTTAFLSGAVIAGEADYWGPFEMAAGTEFTVTLDADADAKIDLRLRQNAFPDFDNYDVECLAMDTGDECTFSSSGLAEMYLEVLGAGTDYLTTYSLEVAYFDH